MSYVDEIRNCSTPAELEELRDRLEIAAFELHSGFAVTRDPGVDHELQLITDALAELCRRLEGHVQSATDPIPF